jgi:uncharacterized membrane protein YeaQ/YmgE (transglycosylase-associated protein family)
VTHQSVSLPGFGTTSGNFLYVERNFPGIALAVRSNNGRESTLGREEAFMTIIGWIVFGLIVGVVGKLLMPGRDPGGFVWTIVLGIAGALLGGFVGRSLGMYGEGEPAGFVMAVIGSIVLLLIYRFTVGRRA